MPALWRRTVKPTFADPLDNPNLSEHTRHEMIQGRKALREFAAKAKIDEQTGRLNTRFGYCVRAELKWLSANGEGEINVNVWLDDERIRVFNEKLSTYPSDELVAFLMMVSPK